MEANSKNHLDYLFNPRSMAIIGASSDSGKWGNWSITGSIAANFQGRIYPVNPKRKEILGLQAFPSILDITDKVDLAVLAVPASIVAQAITECVRKGVKGAVILSGGFAETGEEGKTLQNEIVRIARQGGMRIVGPNCPGISNNAIGLCVGASMHTVNGSIAFVSQSGTLSEVMIRNARAKGCGLSKFIGIGNQADLNGADYLEYLEHDEATRVIVLYIEGLPDGRRFFEVARRVVQKKPVVIYKVGCTSAGQRSALSHTASLTGVDELFDGLSRQIGLLRASETDHAFDMAEALATQPLPKGKRIGIVSGGGALCVTLAENCAILGLEVPVFDEVTALNLKKDLVAHAPIPWNPVDVLAGSGSPASIPLLTDKVAQLQYIDGIITNPIPMIGSSVRGDLASENQLQAVLEATQRLSELPRKYGKPMVVLTTSPNEMLLDILKKASIPYYETPEACARAMSALVKYAEFINNKP